jgi:predicted nucleotidyltransferase
VDFTQPFGGIIPGARGGVLAVLLRTGEPLTGRQVHRLVSDRFSLWSVQEALKALSHIGIVETRTVGRATVHSIDEDHSAVAPLRALSDPIAALTSTVRATVDSSVDAVLVFGSIARGEARSDSDIDLAVIAASEWDRRAELQDAVQRSMGNECDVLVFSPEEFQQLAHDDEPVVADILRDGIALVGSKPRKKRLAAR